MILNQKQTTVAYRCPHCGCAVMSLVGAFALSADMIRLKCPCGGSDLTAVMNKEKKVRLSIPCYLCPSPHTVTVSSQMFFDTQLSTFPCPYSGMPICFVGRQENVQAALNEAEAELRELLGETEFSSLAAARSSRNAFTDPQIMDIVMYVIHDLQAEGEITCLCPDSHGDYLVEILDDCVRITCKNCRASKDIPTDSLADANAFLHCTHIDLE